MIEANLKRTIAAVVLAAAMTLPTHAPRAADLLSALNAAVLDWCNGRSGTFHLPHISAPSCETDNTLYLGRIGIMGENATRWWWEIRSGDPPNLRTGVLWYVPSPTPKELCAVSEGIFCQCRMALAALNNPAQVPVALIGPGAAVCETDQ